MDPGNVQHKLKLLFKKFTEPGFNLDKYYGDSLINKLATKDDAEIINLEKLPLLSDLIIEALNYIDNAHITVQVFIIRLFAVVSYNELHFTKIYCKSTSNAIRQPFKDIDTNEMQPSLKVAYMEAALAFVTHTSGMNWLIESGVWKQIFTLCNQKQTVFIVRQTYNFASKFLWKLNDMGDKENIINGLDLILEPVLVNDYINIETMSSDDEAEHCRVLEPMLHMLLALYNEPAKIHKPTLLMCTLIVNYKVNSHMNLLIDCIHRDDMTFLFSKLLFWLGITQCFIQKPLCDGVVYSRKDFIEVAATYFNTIQGFINRRCATSVLDFCNTCNVIWAQVFKDIDGPIFENCKGEKVLLQQQLIFIQLVPIIVYVKQQAKNYPSDLTDERMMQYLCKLMECSCDHTGRAAYAMRDLMFELDPLAITLQSVKRLSCLRKHISNTQANLIYQALFYVLKDYDPTDDMGQNKPEECYEESQERVQVMTYVMDTVLLLVRDYDIKWQEGLEILCLYSIVHNILTKRPNLSNKFVVTALNIIILTIKKFLPPNLSLLLNATPDSAVHELGNLIHTKMHDLNWEVRDSALELLLVCTEISFIKFPDFQNQIIDNNLINVSATVALNDHEFYVRASALKCLAAATKVYNIWDKLLQQHANIMDDLISIVRNNQEGLVRKEAVLVLCEIYKNVKVNQAFKLTLYEHLASTALTDFHWEVQIAALKFWKIVIQAHLNEQGMLDGTFPPMTFSKESRKIVTLNTPEIQKRLIRCLEELSSIGCLTVLVKLLQEENEISVMDAALQVCQDFLEILNTYKISDVLQPLDNQDDMSDIRFDIKEDNDSGNASNVVPDNTSEGVIDGILNSNDMNLLANIYEKHLNVENVNTESDARPKLKLLKNVSPNLFVSVLSKKDYKGIIENKKQWNDGIRNLSSLLDDVLGIYEESKEINTMDCY